VIYKALFTCVAAAFNFFWEAALAKQFQLFQPIGGVSGFCPDDILNVLFAEPSGFIARKVTT